MKFEPKNLNFELSPYTGLTRDHWIDAAKFLLTGIFQNIKSFDDPVIMPRYETEVSYPNSRTPEWKKQAEIFEGLARSFFISAPLIHIDPDITVCGYSMREYYKTQILRACTKNDPNWVLDFSFMKETEPLKDPFNTYQQTVETSALVICLWMCRDEIWADYTKEEKDLIAGFLMDFAKGNTVPQNWRLFNMLDLAFLNMEGYEIDKDIMRDHAQSILNYYAGDGWYRDGHSFDYYSCWAFNVYGPIWNVWYGYENEPYLAQKFEENSNRLMETYGDFFDGDGFTNMWGRSNIYRNAATSAFDANFLLQSPLADPGLARRISSGSLMQFLGREDLFYKGVPVLGFYGPFVPLVQGYSCAESPFWLGKAFMCLHLPADHPFWTAKENNGTWEKLSPGETKVTVLSGPALCFANHEANKTTELRTGKVVKAKGDEHGMWNYSKLVFNTKYPWESAPCKGVESQQYVLHDLTFDTYKKANVTFWHGNKGDVLYRRNFFDYTNAEECHWIPAVNLADFPVSFGTVRADKMRFFQKPIELTLGGFGFPDNGTDVEWKEKNGAKAVILKGTDACGRKKQMAMTIFAGWDRLDLVKSEGTNPDSKYSLIPYATVRREKQYGYEPYILISQVLTRESFDDFSEDELFSVKAVRYTDVQQCGGYGPVILELADNTVREIDFYGMEGLLAL